MDNRVYELEDPRLVPLWVMVYLNGKPWGMVKDVDASLYGTVRHVAVLVTEQKIVLLRRERRYLAFGNIDINDIHIVVSGEGYIFPEHIQQSLDVSPGVAQEIHGVWQGLTTGYYDRVPVPSYEAQR